jgi:hypothetical protein
MKKTGSDKRRNKISRLEFLRMLGAGTIGYFTCSAGFINSLFENARTATAVGVGNTTQSYAAATVWLVSDHYVYMF